MNNFYSVRELKKIGFKMLGDDVCVSRKASIYAPEVISLGDHVRIDDFCILSGGSHTEIQIGSYVHISAYSAIYGGGGAILEDFSGLSPRCTIFSQMDDFSGKSMIHPFFPEELKPGFISEQVILRKFSQVGLNSSLLPGVVLEEGVAVGAHSLVNKSCAAWGIYAGTPAKRIKERHRDLLDLKKQFISKHQS